MGIEPPKLAQENRAEAIGYMRRLLEPKSHDLNAAVGAAFAHFGPQELPLRAEEITMLRQVLGAPDERVVRPTVDAVRVVAKDDHKFAVDLLNVR